MQTQTQTQIQTQIEPENQTKQNIFEIVLSRNEARDAEFWYSIEKHDKFAAMSHDVWFLMSEYERKGKITKHYNKLKSYSDMLMTISLYFWSRVGPNVSSVTEVLRLNGSICTPIRISRNKSQKISRNVCGICLEEHPTRHLVKTSCGHYFGKKCFTELLQYAFENDKDLVPCPCCRDETYSLSRFVIKK